MGNMLKTEDWMAGYTIEEKLSSRHDGEREVYTAVDAEGKRVVFTVFDLQAERYSEARKEGKQGIDIIDEIGFLNANRGQTGVPKLLECGEETLDGKHYAWMAQQYVEAENLKTLIQTNGALDAADALAIARVIGKVAERAAAYTDGGGHYNISTGNILVKREDGKPTDAFLIGFANIGEGHQGAHRIDIDALDSKFLAPEATKGIFTHKSDIYALGMVLAAIIGEDRMPQPVRLIVQKATAAASGNRFSTMKKFLEFIGKLDKGQGSRILEARIKKEKTDEPATLTAGRGKEASAKGIRKGLEKTGNGEKALDAVAGMADLKNLFRRDFIRILKNPEVAQAYGIKPSNCTLLYGPQGCGKTFIAEKAAQESGLKYRVVNPSELGSIYVHGSQQKIAELFEEAEKKGPMILIFDEFDALVPKRDSDLNGNQANEVNEMLTQLNNCAARGIYVLATTNRPTLLDPAIMRKGRVDRTVYVSLPDKEARKELFRLELASRPHGDMDYDILAEATENYTCSDITYIVEESAKVCFEETLEGKLEQPVPIGMERLKEVIKDTNPSVTDSQSKEYLEVKDRMEKRDGNTWRRVGFA